AFVTWSSPAVSLQRETQDYSARFGVSSQRFPNFLKLPFRTQRSTGLMRRTFVCQNVHDSSLSAQSELEETR
ncbi:MAG TPA: hypothetical protein VF290_17485, partial [Pyrinomonadaceae bacterium]